MSTTKGVVMVLFAILKLITNVKEVSLKLGPLKSVCYVCVIPNLGFVTCIVCIVRISLHCSISLVMLNAGCPYPAPKE